MKEVNTLDFIGELLNRYESQHEKVDSYYGLLAYWALAQAATISGRKDYLEKCIGYLAQYPDHFAHPYYNLESYRLGGNGKAWLIYQGYFPEQKEELRKYAELTCHAPKNAAGIMCRPGDGGMEYARVWIDCATATTPFMLYAGLALGEARYIDYAAEQCIAMYELFLDETCGLLHQGRGYRENPKRMSEDHWSRGNGWGMIGLAELVQYLPADSPYRPKSEAYFKDLADALLPHQTKRGLWRQEIPLPTAWEESSGTALILYGIGVGIRTGLLPEEKYKTAFKKGIYGLAEHCLTEDFATYESCPGCLCPGTGAMKGTVEAYVTLKSPQKDEVHSYGCMMLAFLEAFRGDIPVLRLNSVLK